MRPVLGNIPSTVGRVGIERYAEMNKVQAVRLVGAMYGAARAGSGGMTTDEVKSSMEFWIERVAEAFPDKSSSISEKEYEDLIEENYALKQEIEDLKKKLQSKESKGFFKRFFEPRERMGDYPCH